MTVLRVLSRAELEEMSREAYRRRFPEPPEQRVHRPRNIRPALVLLDAERMDITYRGRAYELRPVSFEDGLRLVEMHHVLQSAGEVVTDEVLRAVRAALYGIVLMAPKYLVPRGLVRRTLWRLRVRRNPFRRATAQEVGELLGFFLASRTTSRVQYHRT